MFIDKQTYLSEDQEIKVSAPSNVFDFGAYGSVVSRLTSTDIQIVLSITGTFIGAGSGESLYLTLQTASDAVFTSPVSLCHTNSIGVADLVAGNEFRIDYLPIDILQYFRLYYNVTGTFLTGYINSSLVLDKQHYRGLGQIMSLYLTTGDDIPILTGDDQYIYVA